MMITMNSRNVLNAVCGSSHNDEGVQGAIDISDSFDDAMDSASSSIDDATEAMLQLQETIAMPPPAHMPPRLKVPMARILASSSPEITALCKNPYHDPRGQDCDVVSMGSSTSPTGGCGSATSLPVDMDCALTKLSKLSLHRRLSHAQLPSCEQICCAPEVEKLSLYKKVSEESSLLLPSLSFLPPPAEDPPQGHE
jgi:hypothetical protein